jgi:hypothetical protein
MFKNNNNNNNNLDKIKLTTVVDITALLLDSIIRNSVCTTAKLLCRRVEVGYEKNLDKIKLTTVVDTRK